MKITLSALAVAGALVCLSTTALAAVPGPAGTPFENNAHLKAQMSNTSPNKIIIDGELITGVTGPENAYTKDNTADGALMITPLTGQDFTLFLETAGGVSVGVLSGGGVAALRASMPNQRGRSGLGAAGLTAITSR